MIDLMSFLSGGGHRIKLKRHEYIRVGIIFLLIILVLLLMVFELKYFNNTFGVKKLVIAAMVLGALIGGLLSHYLTKDKKDMEILTKFQIWIALIICSIIVMPCLASFTNRVLSFSGNEEIPVSFVSSTGFYADRYGLLDSAEPDGFFTFVIKDDELQRVKTSTELFPDAGEGDQVLLPVRRGFWGFEYVVM